VPNAPTTLGLTVVSSSQINLAWTDNSGIETSYKVERSTDGTNYTEIASSFADAVTFASTGLDPSTTYYYRVRAYNCFGFSTYSNAPSATTNSAGGSTLTQNQSITLTGSSADAGSSVTVYPNPFGSTFNVKISDGVTLNKAALKIVDWFGKEVRNVSLSSHSTPVDRGSLQSGIYFYVVTNNGQTIDKGRLIVQ
jgi:hypothetical protein